ncbi:MAG: TSUP family transporter, partial [Burkholderiales bacterium]
NAVATSAALGFPVAVAGTIGYVVAGWSLRDMPPGTIGFIYLPALITISIASVIVAPFGARTAHAMAVRKLRRVFAWLLFGLAAYMIWKAASL